MLGEMQMKTSSSIGDEVYYDDNITRSFKEGWNKAIGITGYIYAKTAPYVVQASTFGMSDFNAVKNSFKSIEDYSSKTLKDSRLEMERIKRETKGSNTMEEIAYDALSNLNPYNIALNAITGGIGGKLGTYIVAEGALAGAKATAVKVGSYYATQFIANGSYDVFTENALNKALYGRNLSREEMTNYFVSGGLSAVGMEIGLGMLGKGIRKGIKNLSEADLSTLKKWTDKMSPEEKKAFKNKLQVAKDKEILEHNATKSFLENEIDNNELLDVNSPERKLGEVETSKRVDELLKDDVNSETTSTFLEKSKTLEDNITDNDKSLEDVYVKYTTDKIYGNKTDYIKPSELSEEATNFLKTQPKDVVEEVMGHNEKIILNTLEKEKVSKALKESMVRENELRSSLNDINPAHTRKIAQTNKRIELEEKVFDNLTKRLDAIENDSANSYEAIGKINDKLDTEYNYSKLLDEMNYSDRSFSKSIDHEKLIDSLGKEEYNVVAKDTDLETKINDYAKADEDKFNAFKNSEEYKDNVGSKILVDEEDFHALPKRYSEDVEVKKGIDRLRDCIVGGK